jgi:hypothetical protein
MYNSCSYHTVKILPYTVKKLLFFLGEKRWRGRSYWRSKGKNAPTKSSFKNEIKGKLTRIFSFVAALKINTC